jgi:serine/threonine protein kinase
MQNNQVPTMAEQSMNDEQTVRIHPAGRPGADIAIGGRTLIGGILGVDYRIEQLLGRGGCGSVYLAHDLPLDRKVAVKIVGAGQSPSVSKDAVQRFMREARAIASVEHPNIVPVYRVGSDPGLSFIVMQYVKGQTLASRLQGEDRLSLADILLVAVQIAAALEAAHGLGLVHRDIKPSNVMIDLQGHVKVMDFGLARANCPDTAITHAGMFIGTPSYSSPEQCETTAIDGRSDLYSLGVILYEMLTGRVPHAADTPLLLMHKIVHEPPPSLQEGNPSVPGDVMEIVSRLLAKNPDDRYPSAAALLVDLRQAVARLRASSSETYHPTIQLPNEIPSSGSSFSRICRRRRAWGRVAAVLALLLTVAALVFHFRLVGGLSATKSTETAVPPESREQLSLAIYDFENATKDPELDWLEIGMPDMLAANFSQYGFIKVRTRDEILWSINPRPERFDDRQLPQLQPLNVAVVARGSVYREGGQLRFVVQLLSLDGHRQVGMVAQKGTVDDVFTAIDALSGQIVERLNQASLDGVSRVTQAKSAEAANPPVATRDLVFAQRFAGAVERQQPAGTRRATDGTSGRAGMVGRVPPAASAAAEDEQDSILQKNDAAEPETPSPPPGPVGNGREERSGGAAGGLKDSLEGGPGAGAGQGTGPLKAAVQGLNARQASFYYRGRQHLLSAQLTREAFETRQRSLAAALLKAGADAAALQRAYRDWIGTLDQS